METFIKNIFLQVKTNLNVNKPCCPSNVSEEKAYIGKMYGKID